MFDNSVSAVVILVEKDELGSINEPDMSVDICAELDIKVLSSSDSAVVNLVDKLLLSEFVEPLMSNEICSDDESAPWNIPVNTEPVIDVASEKSTLELDTVKEPVTEVSDLISPPVKNALPDGPAIPWIPCAPVGPSGPSGPREPVGPAIPCGPCIPCGPNAVTLTTDVVLSDDTDTLFTDCVLTLTCLVSVVAVTFLFESGVTFT